jgi:hypothetical protein
MEHTVITIREYCTYHQPVAPDFIRLLMEHGLIRQADEEAEPAIYFEELSNLERFSRMHYELEINVPGIDTIEHLLQRIQQLQQEVAVLRRRQLPD